MQINIDYAEATFDYQGSAYEVIGGVIHNTASEAVGVGSYEYWGQKSYDSKVIQVSEYSGAEFTGGDIYIEGTTTPLTDPPLGLVEAAQEALYSKTYNQAEEEAAEAT